MPFKLRIRIGRMPAAVIKSADVIGKYAIVV
jgi:hypothetical protein